MVVDVGLFQVSYKQTTFSKTPRFKEGGGHVVAIDIFQRQVEHAERDIRDARFQQVTGTWAFVVIEHRNYGFVCLLPAAKCVLLSIEFDI